jgi:hypothetical protein
MYPNGNDGFCQWAMGTRKQDSQTLIVADYLDGFSRVTHPPTAEVDAGWGQSNRFEILETSEDGKSLQDELNDLDRDSTAFEIASQVSHGAQSEQAPELMLGDPDDSERVAKELQDYLRSRGVKI